MATLPVSRGEDMPPSAAANKATAAAATAAAMASDAEHEAQTAEQRVGQALSEERMQRTMKLPDCHTLRQPRVVSYSEVGDPNGFVVSVLGKR